LALQPHYRDVGIEPSSPTLDGIGRADVFQRDPLVFVDEKHRATSGTDHFLDLVLALVAVEATFFVQPVGLVHDQAFAGVGLDTDVRP
jgi:hypothetical protein